MNRPNDEYHRGEDASYSRNTPERYRNRSDYHKRTVSPPSSRGERYSAYRRYDKSRSRSERRYSNERKSEKRRSESRDSRVIRGSNDDCKRSKIRRSRTSTPRRSPSNSPNIDVNTLNALRENILLALSSNRDEAAAAINSENEWQDTWNIDVESSRNSSGSDDMDVTENRNYSSNNVDTGKNIECIWPKCDLKASGLKEDSTTVEHLIDDEIIQKVISKPVRTTTLDLDASTLQFDFDLVKQALSTVKMLERKDTTHAMSTLTKVQTSTRQDVPEFQPYRHSQSHTATYIPSSQTPRPNVLPSTSTVKPQRLLSPAVKLPIPSTKFLRNYQANVQTSTRQDVPEFQPYLHSQSQAATYIPSSQTSRPNVFPSTSTVKPQRLLSPAVKLPIPSTKFLRNYQANTYGEYRRLQASQSSDVLITMPKKTKTNVSAGDFNSNKIKRNQDCETISSRPSQSDHIADDNSIGQPATLCQSAETTKNRLQNSSSGIETATVSVENPSTEDQAITTLRDSIGTAEFTALVDLIKKMTEGDASLNNNSTATDRDVISSTSTETNRTAITTSKSTSSRRGLIIKNNQREWHSLTKIVSCKVCDKPHGNSLVSHYVNSHPGAEVPISRLAPEAADSLRSRKGILECKVIRQGADQGYRYQQFCYFCNIYRCLPKCSWITHMARHTGYYAYKCNHCSRMLAQKLSHKCSKNNDFTKITHPQFKKEKIKAYVCDRCNYVRFRKREIQKHLNEEHDDDDLKTFKKFNFLRFPCKNHKKTIKNEAVTKSESDCDETSEDPIGNDCEDEKSTTIQDDGDDELLIPMRSTEAPEEIGIKRHKRHKRHKRKVIDTDDSDPEYFP